MDRTVACPACGSANEVGRKFCGECGSPLSVACPSCGTANAAAIKFCGECGTRLEQEVAAAAPAAEGPASPAAERRLVSVLFVDLVGFTAASEGRDAEDTRELLTRYFDLARTTVERYGGRVEKFIGDAVMALWGAPVANEDDAERAVRAALELIAAVPTLDSALRARAGVLTGEAAVSLDADGHGMVAGDLVNTASRIQSAAEPGTVLVGEATRRATEAAIAYADAGEHELKGKAEPVPLARALRVVAGARGSLRTTGLEPPFVGRDRELRLVKDVFHASADEGRAQLVLVSGVAGIGKSRVVWEFEKYIDGLAAEVFWHRGRCLAYGEGVAYWALGEMVRMRCGIVEDEDPDSALPKLAAALAEHIHDEEERAWVEPRLAHLLGLEEGTPGDHENLFSAWRILFERLAEQAPTVLVFEDLQWADAGLLDFLEYLLEWSRGHPLFVLAIARPEFAGKRSTWSAKRSFTQLYLEPLGDEAMDELLAGLVPGLPGDLRRRILEHAAGVPLYAVEIVRMLLDRGLVARENGVYRPTGAVDSLDVPETLHALVAARIDALTAEERRVVQSASVLGKTFTKQGLAALTGVRQAELEPQLASLLRKEIVAVQADPRSPERGQYVFVQDIVKRVAYETLARSDRKAKHLAAAQHVMSAWGGEEDEIVEVVAAHYLEAYAAAPDAADAAEIRDTARTMLVRAGERAASLAAPADAQRAFERAVDLTDDPLEQAKLYERIGMMAYAATRAEAAAAAFERAIRLFESQSATRPAARVSARLAEVMWDRGRIEQGLKMMDRSFLLLREQEPDEDLATLAAQLGRFMLFAGQNEAAFERIEAALAIAESVMLPEVLSQALNTKALLLEVEGRLVEAEVLLRRALTLALEHDKPSAALRASYNLADRLSARDQYAEAAQHHRDALALARRVGNRYWEQSLCGFGYPFFALGEWDEVLELAAELPGQERWTEARLAFAETLVTVAHVHVHRGLVDDAERRVAFLTELETSADLQERAQYGAGAGRLQLARGDAAEALRLAKLSLGVRESLGINHLALKEALVVALEAALALGDLAQAEDLLTIVEDLPPGRRTPFLEAQALRFRAQIAARRGDGEASDRLFKRAIGLFRELATPFPLAVVLLEHAEWLARNGFGGDAEPRLVEAEETFERLRATPWMDRVVLARTSAAARA